MGWNNDDMQPTKKKMDTSSKILLAIIASVVLIIIVIITLLLNVKEITFNISVDEKLKTTDKEMLLAEVDDITYINIEEFSKLVGYEYHTGEYKSFVIEEDKCYVQGTEETASFFLDNNKVCKLPLNDMTSDYMEFIVDNPVKQINGKMYASIEAISIAFNVDITKTKNEFKVYNLSYLVTLYDKKVKELGYTGIEDQNLENQKSLLYGYLIVKKEGRII